MLLLRVSLALVVGLTARAHATPPAGAAPVAVSKQYGPQPYVFYSLYQARYPTCRSDHGDGCAETRAKIGKRLFEPADAIAHRAYAAAIASSDMSAAALKFFECARAYRDVPDSDLLWWAVQKNVQACYSNTKNALLNAGCFAASGKPLLEQAAVDDPRFAPFLRKLISEPGTEVKQSVSCKPLKPL